MNSNDKRDVYYRLAKKHGYRARSVYKLRHMDESYGVFDGVRSVVDLCAAPGSWSQYAVERLGAGCVVSVDVQDIIPIGGVTFIKDDITSETCVERVLDALGRRGADLVICDGAPDVTGMRDLDEYLQTELLVSALSMSLRVGQSGSGFIGKCFRGECISYVVAHFQRFYDSVLLLKPKASRAASIECFIYAAGLRRGDADPLKVDTSAECPDIPLLPCGYGNDPGMEYEVLVDH